MEGATDIAIMHLAQGRLSLAAVNRLRLPVHDKWRSSSIKFWLPWRSGRDEKMAYPWQRLLLDSALNLHHVTGDVLTGTKSKGSFEVKSDLSLVV